jgi:DNA-binding CsgD family transcriptional regulator
MPRGRGGSRRSWPVLGARPEAFQGSSTRWSAIWVPRSRNHLVSSSTLLVPGSGPLVIPRSHLLERHARHGTAHAALIAEILSLLAGRTPARREPPLEPVRDSEMRVLRYLPTNLTAPEIARDLYVSRDTVKTRMRSLYAKFGTHSRADTVDLMAGPDTDTAIGVAPGRPTATHRTPTSISPSSRA